MSRAATHRRRLIVVAAVLGACFASTSATAAQETDWRSKALALNDVTGDGPMTGEIKAWTEKPDQAKQLVATAVTVAKEKDQPFNYNAAYILANVSLNLKDYKSSQTFFEVCAQLALRLRSVQKLGQTYLGLLQVIDGLSGNKDYDRAIKLCQEFLEKLEQEGFGRGARDEILRRMVRALSKQGKKDESWRILNNLLKVRGSDWRNVELKAWLQQESNRTAEVAQTYEELLQLIPKDDTLQREEKAELVDDVRRRLVRTLVKQGKVDEAWRTMDKSLKGSDWRNLELKGWVQQETNHPAEAAETYEAALGLLSKNDSMDKAEKAELIADFHYILSGVYVDNDRIDKAEQHLQILLKQYPTEAKYNNDLGFIWADHDMHLDEAEQMIRKALDEDRKKRHEGGSKLDPDNDKDNAAYLDSLGWVLYKKKKYEEAKPYLQKAVEDKEGQHVEIYDHLGEVYRALGQNADAIAAWKKAVEVTGTTRREQDRKVEVEKKLKKMK
jgi:tetratricopeptide (TPR) repeat protein